jgi:hypothetical protein
MKDVWDAVSTRIKTPYFGYAVLAFIALNWRGLFLLAVTTGTPQDRLSAFDSVTSYHTLFAFPLIIGAAVALITPWLQLLFRFLSSKPLEMIDNINLEAEHKKTIKQTQLEQVRTDFFAYKEKELIDRAKRDEEVASIEDSDTKEKLIAQLQEIRNERDKLSEELETQSNFGTPTFYTITSEGKELIIAASKDKNGTIIRDRSIGSKEIQAGRKSFGAEDSREYAKYDSALDMLHNHGLVKPVGNRGEIFELTNSGWELAESLTSVA